MSNLLRILLIEPDEASRTRASRSLRRHGLTAIAVDGLASGLLRDDLETVDCVVAPAGLSDLTGPKLVRAIRHHLPRVPLVVVGEESDQPEELTLLNAGADEFVLSGELRRRHRLGWVVQRAVARSRAHVRRQADHQESRRAAWEQIVRLVANRVNNPIAFITSNNTVLRGTLEDLTEAIAALADAPHDADWLNGWRARFGIDATLLDAREICGENHVGMKQIGTVMAEVCSARAPQVGVDELNAIEALPPATTARQWIAPSAPAGAKRSIAGRTTTEADANGWGRQ